MEQAESSELTVPLNLQSENDQNTGSFLNRSSKLVESISANFHKTDPVTQREINFNGTVAPPNKVPNVIRNQKYSIITFLPIVLFNQFKFFFNLFFLLTALSQFYPPLKTGYLISFVGPLVLVLTLTMAKEAYDDFERFKRDREANSTKYTKLTGIAKVEVPSSSLKVGDIIEIHAGKRIPADLILLYTPEQNGSVFLKTDQLDGETDWKVRKAIRYTQSYVEKHGNFAGLEDNTRIVSSLPILDIYKFEGVFLSEKEGGSGIKESLSLENTLWASTVLATGTVYGMVLYTGKEMRVVMNTTNPRTKVGKVEQEMNLLSKVLFAVLVALSVVIVGLQGFTENWLIEFLRFVILLASIIPISLRVNMDFAKIVYSWMMAVDKQMEGIIVRNRSIPEELGRLEFLLTDKTGTLTQNEMIWKKLALHNGKEYAPENIEQLKKIMAKQQGGSKSSNNLSQDEESNTSRDSKEKEKSPKISVQKVSHRELQEQLVRETIMAIALCHNVTPVVDKGERVFQASSPDEIALVKTIETFGLELVQRDQNTIWLRTGAGEEEEYQILANFPFSSETKRMGIVVKNLRTQQIMFYLKGADAIMKGKIPQRQRGYLEETCESLAMEGLRTLVFAEKQLTEEAFNQWNRQYLEATQSMTKRQQKIQKAIETLEVNMKFLGITGVEDKLQEDVLNTLESLKQAGVKIWMLTGDKIETAITIAISTGIKASTQPVFIMKDITEPLEIANKLSTFRQTTNEILVIDGSTLDLALNGMEKHFFESTAHAPGVVCCRCSPTQKSRITEGVKKIIGKKTCAIGDGGNDVGMIQAADVGIGIEGKEGKQAALAADYSILHFKGLVKLLLWHGRLSYKRSATLGHFVIHRGLIISFIQAIFSILFYNLSISIYSGALVLGYSTFFTNFPVFSLVFDEDVDVKTALGFPILYRTLQRGRELGLKNFFIWVWRSLYQAAIIMMLSLYLFENSFYNLVTITFTSLILSELLNVTTTLHRLHLIAVISMFGSIIIYMSTILILKEEINTATIDLEFVYKVSFLTLVSWFPIHALKMIRSYVYPTEQEKIMRGAKA